MTEASTAFSGAAKPYVFGAGKKAIADHLAALGREGSVVAGAVPGTYRVRYVVRGQPPVSIIVPTKDKIGLLGKCLASIVAKTAYGNYEVLVIDNNSVEEKTRAYLSGIVRNPKIRVVPYDRPFNFSALNNFAAREARGEHLLFLNNDTEVLSPEWLGEMLSYSQRPDVGAVGAKLYYPDNTTQHAGVIVGIGGVAGHSHKNAPRTDAGYMARLSVVQNVSSVTAACLLMRRKVFEEVGGFDEALPVAFNDIDFCLRIRRAGYLIVFTPYAELYHHESRTRGYEVTPERLARLKAEVQYMRKNWGEALNSDPYYSPHLTLESEDFSLRLPAESVAGKSGAPRGGA
jgi:GT2 family glycosyltransferase